MLLQRSLSILCALLALAVASPAPVSNSGSAKLLLSHSQRLPLAAKYHLSLYNTRFQRHPVGKIFKALHERNVSPGPLVVNRIHSIDGFRQAHDTVRRAHDIGPREGTMTRPEIAIPAGRLADHQSIQPDSSPEESPANDDAELECGRGDGLTGSICTNSTDCADGRICINTDADTCSSGDICVCVPSDGPEPCTSSADCLTAGEVCVQLSAGSVCLSEKLANGAGIPNADDESSGTPEETPANEDTDSHDGSGDGITGSTCTCSSSCAEGRFCTNGNTISCPAGDSCICMPLSGMQVCSSSAECLTGGEVCVRVIRLTLCLSEEVAIADGIPILDGVSS